MSMSHACTGVELKVLLEVLKRDLKCFIPSAAIK